MNRCDEACLCSTLTHISLPPSPTSPYACSRLRMIVDTLFPRAGRLQPKDMPLNIFVKIIHYIAKVN